MQDPKTLQDRKYARIFELLWQYSLASEGYTKTGLAFGRQLFASPCTQPRIYFSSCGRHHIDTRDSKSKTRSLTWHERDHSGHAYNKNPAAESDGLHPDLRWARFQTRVLSLPPEICRMIMDLTYMMTFGPRKVRPGIDAPTTNSFLSLDKESYHKYYELYWKRNTWAIDKGPTNPTMRFMTKAPFDTSTSDFSRQTPNNAALQIRRIELSFSKQDIMDFPASQKFTGLDGPDLSISPSHTLQLLRVCKECRSDLLQIWQDKFDRVAFLRLEHLTLDLADACSPNGEYLGFEIVQRLIPFYYGLPTNFEILAPTAGIGDDIRKIFTSMNTPGSRQDGGEVLTDYHGDYTNSVQQ
ncbi:hypothetical protein MMC28_008043 [Mycoblastus sanguinarius]|nr:hypothetical protein [Mycoblastus sanguinarius]